MNVEDLEVCYLSATELLKLYRSKKLSPVDVMVAMLRRAEEIQETINPFADTFYEQAIDSAKGAEQRYIAGTAKPLDGIPLLIKDNIPIEGIRHTVGSYVFEDTIEDATDPAVKRLIDDGAIFFARSTCPEFCWLYSCHSRMWGVTRNPWRHDVSPGGSSGGSAAALAAGATTLAIGTDSTGSTRHPASQCGVVGYKPPFGRNPAHYSGSYLTYNSVGPMTRTVADSILMQNIMSGPYSLDPNSIQQRSILETPTGDLNGLIIAFSMDLGFYDVDSDVRREILKTIYALEDTGAKIETVDIDWAEEPTQLAHKSEIFMMGNLFEEVSEHHMDKVSAYVPELIEAARSVSAAEYRSAKSVAAEVWFRHMGPLLTKYDALITPTVSSPEIPVENGPFDLIEVNGVQQTDTDTSMNALFNMFNQCPALSVPSGFSQRKLPIGIQIISRPYQDETVYRVALAIEQRLPWLHNSDCRPKDA